MNGRRKVATAFATGLAITSVSMNAAAALHDGPVRDMVAQAGVAVETLYDGFAIDDASRGLATHSLGDPQRPTVVDAAAREPWAMTMACLGLMTIIVYRRRML